MGGVFKVIGIFFGVIATIALAFAGLMDVRLVPSHRVVTQAQMPERQLAALAEESILERGETIELFYADGLLSVTSGGSILTDRRVIAYETGEDDEIYVYDIPTGEIAAVEMIRPGDALNYQIYEVSSTNGEDWLELWLPHEYGDAERFADAVTARIAD